MKKIFLVLPLFFISLIIGLNIHLLWASDSEATTFRFPEVAEWKLSDDLQTFLPETLYEYIDGGADLYLSFDFEELQVAEYLNDKKASMTVEVYRHKTPFDAFGIYSQERLPSADPLNIGAQGYADKDMLNFVLGNYYVKIDGYKIEDQTILTLFARKVAESLGEKGALPGILSAFPQEGKVKNSEKYVAKNFLGYSFLRSAFTAEYELTGKKFKMFVIQCGEKKECADMIGRYLKETGDEKKAAEKGNLTLSDPHHGAVGLRWKGNKIWGTLEIDDPSIRSKYLNLFEETLKKAK